MQQYETHGETKFIVYKSSTYVDVPVWSHCTGHKNSIPMNCDCHMARLNSRCKTSSWHLPIPLTYCIPE